MDPQIAAKIAEFFEPYPVRSYRKGQILIHAGDDPKGVLHLISGRVKQYDLTPRGDEVVLNAFAAPAFFPMSFAMNRTPNEYFFEAESDIRLHTAPVDDVLTFLRDEPAVLYDLLSRVYRGTDGMLRRMAHLMASSARSRVLYELVIESRRFGHEHEGSYELDMNESAIGARAGLSRETVSREISKLKTAGLITGNSKSITILNLSNLEQLLGHEL